MKFTLTLVIFMMLAIQHANSLSNNETFTPKKSEHMFSLAWSFYPILGIIGTILNSYVLYMFVQERQNMISLINLLILLDTLYRLVISLVGVQWKSFLMATDFFLFPWLMSNQMVCRSKSNLIVSNQNSIGMYGHDNLLWYSINGKCHLLQRWISPEVLVC